PVDLSAKLIYLKIIEVSPVEKPESTDTRLCGHKLHQSYLYQISPLHFKENFDIFYGFSHCWDNVGASPDCRELNIDH
ncbi:MAG: hypothetical protein ACYSW7_09245, partial [Planctomycetota bacterium]